MAAGLILKNVTTSSGVTVPTLMWADDTVTPTQITPIALLVDSSGVEVVPATEATLSDLLTAVQGPIAAGTNVIGKLDHATTGLGHGHKEVTTAGTPVQLASTTAAKWVSIQPYRSNTGYIAIGGANTVSASATAGTGTGISVAPGDIMTLAVDDLADVWLDSQVNGEGVRFTYGT